MIRFDGRNEVCVEKDQIAYEIATINDCVMFFKGSIFQGERLLESLESRNCEFHDLIKLEEEFFVFSLDRAIFHMKRVKTISEFESMLKQIDTEIGHDTVKDIRDMRTHFDDYQNCTKKAKKQKEFFVSLENLPAPLSNSDVNVDATSSIMVGDFYLIGGRIDFHKTMQLLKELLPNIEKLCDSKRAELVKLQVKKKET